MRRGVDRERARARRTRAKSARVGRLAVARAMERERSGEREPLVRGRAGANDGDVESGRWTAVGRWKWTRTARYAIAFVVLSLCAGALVANLSNQTVAGDGFSARLVRRARVALFSSVRKDGDAVRELQAPQVLGDFCRALGTEGACEEIQAARAGLGAVDEEAFQSLVSQARAVRDDASGDSAAFLGAYDGIMTEIVTEPRAFAKYGTEWSTAGLGFEGSAELGAQIEAKKLSSFVVDVLPLLRKYPTWDMSDTNTIRYLTRHINEAKHLHSDVPVLKDEAQLSATIEDQTHGSGVLPPKDPTRDVQLSAFAANNQVHSVYNPSHKMPALGAVYLNAEKNGLPKSFDAREAFPKCARILGTVRDQGKCGSCWAVAATEMMNDRLCVGSEGNNTAELSPQYPLSCYDSGYGCDGGDVLDTLDLAVTKGIPYGGMLDSQACLPYEFPSCNHPCMVPGTKPQRCPTTCANGSPISFVYPKSKPYTCPRGDVPCIAKEIQRYGSVAVTFGPVHPDFYYHKQGVYKVPADAGRGLGQHATKLIGWGVTEGGEHYWLMVNSWNNWGEQGVGRVRMGEMQIESGIAAVAM